MDGLPGYPTFEQFALRKPLLDLIAAGEAAAPELANAALSSSSPSIRASSLFALGMNSLCDGDSAMARVGQQPKWSTLRRVNTDPDPFVRAVWRELFPEVFHRPPIDQEADLIRKNLFRSDWERMNWLPDETFDIWISNAMKALKAQPLEESKTPSDMFNWGAGHLFPTFTDAAGGILVTALVSERGHKTADLLSLKLEESIERSAWEPYLILKVNNYTLGQGGHRIDNKRPCPKTDEDVIIRDRLANACISILESNKAHDRLMYVSLGNLVHLKGRPFLVRFEKHPNANVRKYVHDLLVVGGLRSKEDPVPDAETSSQAPRQQSGADPDTKQTEHSHLRDKPESESTKGPRVDPTGIVSVGVIMLTGVLVIGLTLKKIRR